MSDIKLAVGDTFRITNEGAPPFTEGVWEVIAEEPNRYVLRGDDGRTGWIERQPVNDAA
jgi:hypothetical protein